MQRAKQETDGLPARLERVRARIAERAHKAGRSPEEITLVAVSKTQPAAVLREAIEAGVTVFGENRVQEAEEKAEALGRGAGLSWQLIGHLQANKARRAARLFDCIQSVDSEGLIGRLERVCEEEGRESLDVLLQLDLAGEATKTGAPLAELDGLFGTLERCKRLRCRGLMTLPPYFEDPQLVRPYFRKLRELRDTYAAHGRFADGGPGELSMGMSHDFEIAVEEGATLVRVGTAIFGARGAAQ